MEIVKSTQSILSLDWFSLQAPTESVGHKIEIQFDSLSEGESVDIAKIIAALYEDFEGDLLVSMRGMWGAFCLDTWDFANDVYQFDPQSCSPETARYLQFLARNGIHPEYDGSCKVVTLTAFCEVVAPCVMNHIAPYSPYFYSLSPSMVFYFHHTVGIGIYFASHNDWIGSFLEKAASLGGEILVVK